MRKVVPLAGRALVAVVCVALLGAAREVSAGHGIAMHGDLKYGETFEHFDYVDPQARKGGEVKLAAIGTYDSFNPFIVKGNPESGIGRIYDTLLTPAADEPFSAYGLLAESVDSPPDRSSVTFTLRADARWHDGRPVTVEDVAWSFETLRTKGLPFFRAYYRDVTAVELSGDRTIKFVFTPEHNRELPLILGQFPVLPKHYWKERDFEKTTLDAPLGSGPYRVGNFEPGRRVTYVRVDDYWGKALPVNVGRHNFGTVRIDYYRDSTVAIEAFKAGEYDFRLENSSKDWATAYDFPALRQNLVRKEEVAHERSTGMQGYAYNTRRALFQDRRVRAALACAFDFEWSNKTLFYGQYTRTRSYFENSELAATGLPGPAELEVLSPFRGRVPDEVFNTEFHPPQSDGSGNVRANLRRAVELLREAGWKVDKDTRLLTHAATGSTMEFEVLLVNPLFERITLPFVKNLERLGVRARVRSVDTAQYRRRVDRYDFDVIVHGWGQSLSPGNEQRNYWKSAFADHPGSQNVVGIKDPAIDELVELLINASDRTSLVARTRALDRVLQWGHWVIPHWHIPYDRLVFWDKFGRPERTPEQGYQFDAWWIDAARATSLAESRGRQP